MYYRLVYCFEYILPAFDMQPGGDTRCDNGGRENNRQRRERLKCIHPRKSQALTG